MRVAALSGWSSEQKHVVAASFLGWTLDAFDFLLMVFVLSDIVVFWNCRCRSNAFVRLRLKAPRR